MSIFTKIADGFHSVWEGIKHAFHVDVEPVVKSFLQQFATDDGKLILAAGIEAVGRLAAGETFGAVATELLKDLISKSETIAAQDAKTTLLQVQSAMQMAKVANGVLTQSDEATVASVK